MGLTDLLSIGSGSLVGFSLGLLGGGGSILAVPLLVYFVGVRSPPVAPGPSAFAGAVTALSHPILPPLSPKLHTPCPGLAQRLVLPNRPTSRPR